MIVKQHKESGLWVSSDGRVIQPPCHKFPKFRWTYGCKRKNGYMVVKFKGKYYYVHRLVAETHVPNPNPEEYKTVDHYPDRNPSNNRADNLRWADMHMQQDNRQVVYDALERYGVRECEDSPAYMRARYAKNPDFAERHRVKSREWYANNTERHRARCREYYLKQKALGKRQRTCPDGKRRRLTDAEFDALYKKSPLMARGTL